MTKKDLIEWLAPYPDDTHILTGDYHNELRNLNPAKINVMRNLIVSDPDMDEAEYFAVDKSQSDIEAIWL